MLMFKLGYLLTTLLIFTQNLFSASRSSRSPRETLANIMGKLMLGDKSGINSSSYNSRILEVVELTTAGKISLSDARVEMLEIYDA